jgi:hypothetical protein
MFAMKLKLQNVVTEERETMATLKRFVAAGVMVLGAAGAAGAQVSQAEAAQIHLRQQMATMETVLQQAIRHGADNVYAQFRSIIQDKPRLGPSRVSGFTLPGYGPVFHVDVPMIQMPILFEVMLRDAQFRSAVGSLQQMQDQWSRMPPGRERDQMMEAIIRLRQDLDAGNLRAPEPRGRSPLVPAGLALPIEKQDQDPESAYTREVKNALIDAMLTNSAGLTIGPDEWLTIVARDAVANDPQNPGASVDSSKFVMRVKGSVLSAFQSKSINKEEARKMVEETEQ